MNRKALSTFVAAGLLAASLSVAEESHHHRQHGAHEHGVGGLTVALEGSELVIALKSPAANIVGFEHAPQDEVQRAALDKALASLKDPDALFGLPEGASCTLIDVSVETPLTEGGDRDDEHHDKAHAHEKEELGHHDQAHANIEAEYHYDCRNAEALRHVDVRLFEVFPATESLNVQYVTSRAQGAVELNAKSSRIEF